MPQVADHVALANRNQLALDYLLARDGEFAEWVATVAFYKAVQIVEALFVALGPGGTSDHRERLRRLKQNNRFANIHKHYRPLWSASTIARYLHDNNDGAEYRTFTDYLAPGKVKVELINHRLKQIEDSARKLAPAAFQQLSACWPPRGPAKAEAGNETPESGAEQG